MRDAPWKDIFKLSASAAAASEFCEWVQVGIDVYITHPQYQVKLHSSPWFSAACAAAIVRNHFFRLHQKHKSSESKVKFRQASNCCKRILEDAKLAYINKTRVHHFPETWVSGLLQLANGVFDKGKSAIPPLFNDPEVLSSASDEAKFLLKTFLRTLILMTLDLFTCFPF